MPGMQAGGLSAVGATEASATGVDATGAGTVPPVDGVGCGGGVFSGLRVQAQAAMNGTMSRPGQNVPAGCFFEVAMGGSDGVRLRSDVRQAGVKRRLRSDGSPCTRG